MLSLLSLLLISLVMSAAVDDDEGNHTIINIYGTKGAKGEKGDTGVAGQTGMLGPKGGKGNIGLQGLNGKKALNGSEGQKGQPGSRGVKGPHGPIGQKGDKGSSKTPQSVAFSVGRSTKFTASVNYQVIPMDHVFYNNKNYFNTNSNRFKAPFAGIYAFNFGAANAKKSMYIFLYAGNPETQRAFTFAESTTHKSSASGFIILQLKAGETASMRLYKGYTVNGGFGSPVTFFSGFLIQALT